MEFRKAVLADVPAIALIFQEVIEAQEQGLLTVGWQKGVYPTEETARAALQREDLFAAEDGGRIVATAIINQLQVDVYENAPWQYPAKAEEVMVLHTLAVSPEQGGKGCGSAFVKFYEDYARQHGCFCLRMDTNERNLRARRLYERLGYREIGVAPCTFNGIGGVRLVLLEKHLEP